MTNYVEFDKNQREFPSSYHKDIWWWAIGLVPLDISLTDEIKSKCPQEVLEGCIQWYEYFKELCSDMYLHTGLYSKATARQYRDFLERIAENGTISGDFLEFDYIKWNGLTDKLNKSKAYRTTGLTLDYIIGILSRTGLQIKENGNIISIKNEKYPKIFHAMNVFENSPNVKDTQTRGHFANCEFRQLYKCYNPNYSELLRKASNDSLFITQELHEFAKEIKITRYIHFGITKYKFKNMRVFDYSLHYEDMPALRINMGTCVDYRKTDDIYFQIINNENDSVKDLFLRSLIRCKKCKPDCSFEYTPMKICGEDIYVCQNPRLSINPEISDLPQLRRLILARKASIENIN